MWSTSHSCSCTPISALGSKDSKSTQEVCSRPVGPWVWLRSNVRIGMKQYDRSIW